MNIDVLPFSLRLSDMSIVSLVNPGTVYSPEEVQNRQEHQRLAKYSKQPLLNQASDEKSLASQTGRLWVAMAIGTNEVKS
jgi:hypothetical protein